MPKVSVIITSYNQEAYLIEAIESALAQTVRPHEIIVADDRSEDHSVETIRGYMACYPGLVKGLFQERNVGISENRNAALRLATGDHVSILDGDDRYLPENLERQLEALARFPRARCSYGNLYFVDQQGDRERIRDRVVQPSGDIFTYIAAGRMGLLRSMLMPLELVKEAGWLDPRYPKHDGYVLSLRLAKLAEYVYVFEPIAEYRVHQRGDSKTYTYRPRVGYLGEVYGEVERLIQDLSPRERERVRTIWYSRLLRTRALADLEEGRRAVALLRFVGGLIRRPGAALLLTRLTQQMCRGSLPSAEV